MITQKEANIGLAFPSTHLLVSCEICGNPAMEGLPTGMPHYCQRHVFIIARIIERTGNKERTREETLHVLAEAEADKTLGGQGFDKQQEEKNSPAPGNNFSTALNRLLERDSLPHTESNEPLPDSKASGQFQTLITGDQTFDFETPKALKSLSGAPLSPKALSRQSDHKHRVSSGGSTRDATKQTLAPSRVNAHGPKPSDSKTREEIRHGINIGTILAILVVGVLIPLIGLDIFLNSIGQSLPSFRSLLDAGRLTALVGWALVIVAAVSFLHRAFSVRHHFGGQSETEADRILEIEE